MTTPLPIIPYPGGQIFHYLALACDSSDIHVDLISPNVSDIFNKRSMDLGVLLDGCSWYDIWQFSADVYRKLTAAD